MSSKKKGTPKKGAPETHTDKYVSTIEKLAKKEEEAFQRHRRRSTAHLKKMLRAGKKAAETGKLQEFEKLKKEGQKIPAEYARDMENIDNERETANENYFGALKIEP